MKITKTTNHGKALIKKFGSINKMKDANISEFTDILPENIAINLKKYLNEFKKDDNNENN